MCWGICTANQVPEALALLYKTNPNAQQVRAFHAQAGFVLLADLQFVEALSHFQLSMLDPREIIALFPQLRLASLPYEPSHPAHPCHWLANAMADMPALSASASAAAAAAAAAAGASGAAGAAGGAGAAAYEPHANIADLVAHGKAARKRRSDEAREHKIEIELVRFDDINYKIRLANEFCRLLSYICRFRPAYLTLVSHLWHVSPQTTMHHTA
jgi:hypothetical protein